MCGVTFQQISKYERGDSRPSIAALWVIAEALGAPLEYFLAPASNDSTPVGADRLLIAYRRLSSKEAQARLIDVAEELAEHENAA